MLLVAASASACSVLAEAAIMLLGFYAMVFRERSQRTHVGALGLSLPGFKPSSLPATEEKAVCVHYLKAWATEDCGTHSYIAENEEGDIHTHVKTATLQLGGPTVNAINATLPTPR